MLTWNTALLAQALSFGYDSCAMQHTFPTARAQDTLNRRAFLAVVAGGLLSAPLAAQAQPKAPVRIGFLPLGSPSNTYDRGLVDAFRQGLSEAGVVENRDVVLDIEWISSEPEASQAVDSLIQRGAKLLIPVGSTASVAAKRRTSTIPILFISVGNPVGMGLVKNLSHPNSNATGFSDVLGTLSGKYLELARELTKSNEIVDYLLAYRMAGRATQASSYRTGGAIAWREASITRNRRRRRRERSFGFDKEGWGGDARHSAEPIHIPATNPAHRRCGELWLGDHRRLATNGQGGGVDRVRPGLY
jgi:hypothetical protein